MKHVLSAIKVLSHLTFSIRQIIKIKNYTCHMNLSVVFKENCRLKALKLIFQSFLVRENFDGQSAGEITALIRADDKNLSVNKHSRCVWREMVRFSFCLFSH